MRRVLALLLLAGVAVMLRGGPAGAASVLAVQPASVSGQIRNGSAGGQTLGGVEVDLHAFDGSNDQIVATTTSDAAGSYHFENLTINQSAQYSVSVTFAKVPYFSPPFKFDASGHQATDLTVYNTTASDAAIAIDRLSIVIANVDAKQRLLTLVESYHFNNSGSETYVGQLAGSQLQTLRFPLFDGAQSLTPEGGFQLSDATSIPSGFALSLPVLPGASTIVFAYQVPYRGRALALGRVLAYRTTLAEVILPGGMNVNSPQLSGQGTVSVGGQNLATIQGKELQPGADVRLDLSGLPLGGGTFLPLDSLGTQLLLVAIVITAAAVSVGAYRGRGGRRPAAGPNAERRRLLQRIAQLDDRYETGELEQGKYTRERQAAKARLREIALGADPDPTRPIPTEEDAPSLAETRPGS